jgi:hypothetical protein
MLIWKKYDKAYDCHALLPLGKPGEPMTYSGSWLQGLKVDMYNVIIFILSVTSN